MQEVIWAENDIDDLWYISNEIDRQTAQAYDPLEGNASVSICPEIYIQAQSLVEYRSTPDNPFLDLPTSLECHTTLPHTASAAPSSEYPAPPALSAPASSTNRPVATIPPPSVPKKPFRPDVTYTLNPWLSASHLQSLDQPTRHTRAYKPSPKRPPARDLPVGSHRAGGLARSRNQIDLSVRVEPFQRPDTGETGETGGLKTAGMRALDEYLCFPSSASSVFVTDDDGRGDKEQEEQEDLGGGIGVIPDNEEVVGAETRVVTGEESNERTSNRAMEALIAGNLDHLIDGTIDEPQSVEERSSESGSSLDTTNMKRRVIELTRVYLDDLTALVTDGDAGPTHTPEGEDRIDRSFVELTSTVQALWNKISSGHTQSTSNSSLSSPITSSSLMTPPYPARLPGFTSALDAGLARKIQGGWTTPELIQLRHLVSLSKEMLSVGPPRVKIGKGKRRDRDRDLTVDWDWVCDQMNAVRPDAKGVLCSVSGIERTKHQILCKAVELGLKKPVERRGKKRKRELAAGSDPAG